MSNATASMDPISPEAAVTGGEWFTSPPRHEEASDYPAWYRDLRAESWHQFLETPAPGKTDESWRFANLKQIQFENVRIADPVSDTEALVDDSRSRGLSLVAARFVFINNRLALRETPALPSGVVCLPISEAIVSHSDLVRSHFMQEENRLGSAKFSALHGSATLSGLFIHVPSGVTVEDPIEVSHWVGGDGSVIFPHALIIAESGASVSVVERHRSINSTDSTLTIGMADLAPENGGRVQYVCVQNLNDHSRQVQLNGTRVGRDAVARSCFVNLGGKWIRNESVSRLTGTGANSEMLSANLADGDQEFDQRTLQLHEAQHTNSDLLYKNALYDRSRTIFAGLIRVCPGAHHTDAYQKCRNLLGSEEAEANSMPGLEIDADQVKCSHGATSGQISEEEIFYLRARGIEPRRARQMISQGFLNEVVERLDGVELREAIEHRFEERFSILA
ncbi:MAG: Fe-S cluster assembly protein SufD [Verrucomicrobiae bacterium]|nr:Fe-S cluster assembly protein SufD [Verrucomicrobiae bacterium]MCB1091539.1 Fe-S cluster assembly protein SufD [Verrucomicrobiae bacterium]